MFINSDKFSEAEIKKQSVIIKKGGKCEYTQLNIK